MVDTVKKVSFDAQDGKRVTMVVGMDRVLRITISYKGWTETAKIDGEKFIDKIDDVLKML